MIASVVLALAAVGVTPDLIAGASAESTAGIIPITETATTSIYSFALTPSLGGLLTAQHWNLRVDYNPRIYLRIPLEAVERPLLLNQVNGSFQWTFDAGWSINATAYGSFGESDFGRASLLAEQVGGQPINLGEGILVTNAIGTTTSLTANLQAGRRLVTSADFNYTQIQTTAEGQNNFPEQLRGGGTVLYSQTLNAVDEVTGHAHFGWVDIIRTVPGMTPDLPSTVENQNFRTLELFGDFSHRMNREWRLLATGGGSVLLEDLTVLPILGLTATYTNPVTPSLQLGASLGTNLQGFVDPATSTYHPRLTINLNGSLTGRDLSAALTVTAYTGAYQFQPVDPAPPVAPVESGITVSIPITYHVNEELSITASGRMSRLAPHLQNPDFEVRAGELLATLTIEYTVNTADTPTAQALIRR